MNDFLNVVKKVALNVVESSQPSDFCFGKVINTSPLQISVEQKMTLGKAQLILTRNVTDFKVKITDSEKREITIHNALKKNDEVILLKKKGGQKYLVLDRVVKT
jgi:hypothetical protein